ncbi:MULTISPECIES: MFS transporter [Streptomycetaceae]|uniref:Efflux membrane protein n=1 Tax=Streptantibioticus cattleyicolor (strain ATCC 35852 / DSM 46488 / JCM 4925 / NBRC 14057 / NRRL 8057) TaxID=1003195 RepID=F8JQV0_STREN|nr:MULTISPECIES: MFS transporter [Streptomycetaceae]AEW92836.1 efflux membrane protein [Streptantibioticus cattleyicolor NRRL 8057 = DSM 46488]MYS57594.1 DHA2 family efflux MFS transporter permease subunit [Streptomyces sp. SID5468]CCB73189.1 putative efflux protein [Streptantibioticus cattleyicolor NRRL 8057 = DSM 46488]
MEPGERRRRRMVLAVCCTSVFIGNLNNTVLNVALPAMQRDLHSSLSGLQWTTDAYLIVLAALLMLAGSAGDRLGRRRVFQTGLVVFTLGSLLCGLAPGLGWLTGFRVLQAIGASMLNPVAMSIITNVFTGRSERARAIGVWGAVMGVAMAAGPLVGGVLVQAAGWRSIFWLNLPIGLAAVVCAARFVPESRAAVPRRMDPVGQLLVVVLMASLTYAIIEAPATGWGAPATLGCAVAAGAALIGLIGYERRRSEPLVDLRVFRSAAFSGASAMAVCSFFVLGGFLFLNTLYLQNVRGLSALAAGAYLLPMAGMNILTSPVSGRLTATCGPRLPLLLAGAATTGGGLLLAAADAETSNALLFPAYCLIGIGVGLANTPVTNAAMTGMPTEQAGVAAAVVSTCRQFGQALGVAVLGAVLAAGLHDGGYARYVPAARPAYWIVTACGAAILVLTLLTTARRAPAPATGPDRPAPRPAAYAGGTEPTR